MTTITQKRNILLTRRHQIEIDLEKYQIQLRSKNRPTRKYARKVLEALYMEQFYVNRDLQRLVKKELARATIQNFFTRH